MENNLRMPLHLLKADRSDIPHIVNLYFTTFKSPIVLHLKPDVPPVREWYKRSLERDFEKPNTRIYKVVESHTETVQESVEIIAFGKWSLPATESSSAPEAPIEWPAEGDVVMFEEVIGITTQKRKEIMGDKEHHCKQCIRHHISR